MNGLRRILPVLLFLLLSFLLCDCAPATAGERVQRMDVDALVSPDATISVTERIVFVTDLGNRRGLIRNIPIVQRVEGKRVASVFRMVSATLDGQPVPYVLERIGPDVEIHLGDESFLTPGYAHEYVLRYTMTDQLLFHPDADELYWNATGNEWVYPIEAASFRVSPPAGTAIKKQDAWMGGHGRRERSWKISPAGRLETTRALRPREGLTVSTTWDRGFVTPSARSWRARLSRKLNLAWDDRKGFVDASPAERLRMQLQGRGRAAFALFVLLVIFGYTTIWYRWGRDPRRGIVIPLFSPPLDMEAGYIGYAKTLEFDETLLLADLVQLAVQGQLRLEPGKYYLKVEKIVENWGAKVSPAHRRLLGALFGEAQKTVYLGGETKEDRIAAQDLVRQMPAFYEAGPRENRTRPRLVLSRRGFRAAALALFVPLACAMFTMESPLSGDMRLLPLSILSLHNLFEFWLPVVLLPLILLSFMRRLFLQTRRDYRRSKQRGSGRGRIVVGLLIVLFLFLFWFWKSESIVPQLVTHLARDPLLVGGLWFSMAFACLLSALMPVRTREGGRLLDQVEGFEMYLRTAEKDSLEKLYPTCGDAVPAMTTGTYERFLPYAFALGVLQAWTEAFTPLLEKSQYQPRWYRGGYDTRSFAKTLQKSGDAMRPASRGGISSGRGGRGSSGGGFGGGGGRGR